MEIIYSRELGLRTLQNATPHANTEYRLSDALAIYHRLKDSGTTKLFFEVSNRSIRYVEECLGHYNLTEIGISDASRLRDRLFARGISSSSVKRVFPLLDPLSILHSASRGWLSTIYLAAFSFPMMAQNNNEQLLGYALYSVYSQTAKR